MAKLKSSSNSMRTLGSSAFAEEEREKDDFYATDPNSVFLFFDKFKGIQPNDKNWIWEPACGKGHMSKALIEKGFSVYSTDLVDRGYGDATNVDFLGMGFNAPKKPDYIKHIITNPPYSVALDFSKRALDLIDNGNYVIMYLRILFLEGKARKIFFEEHPPKYIYVHSSRQSCAKGGDFETYTGSAMAFAWFVWEKGCYNEPIVRWL